jgi:sugar phosphate isomerase/epimerase
MTPAHRIAVCSWSLGSPPADQLAAVLHRLGVPAVQLALSPLVGGGTASRSAIASLRSAGIEIVSGMMAMAGEDYSTLESIARTGGVRPNATWPANCAHADAVARLAEEEGIRLVTFHAGFIPKERHDPERRVLLDRLGAIAQAFNRRGIDLALETGQETADTLLDALIDVGVPNLGVNFDPANMILYGKGEPVAALRGLAPYVRQVHVKDAFPATTEGEWGREVPAGTGAVDWPAFFEAARSITPPMNFVIEREAGSRREADIAAARDLIQGHLCLGH